jgi:mono/diheme cytochrome c family protein
LFVCLSLLLAACSGPDDQIRPGMEIGNDGLMTRHHAEIPVAYAGLTNPIQPDEASLARGGELYAVNCASCHGDGGMGDGPAGAALDPVPAPVAHTSRMMADDYLFWRISEGGAQFNTSMPPWKVLDEQARWDLVNYMRALGSGSVEPASHLGGATFDSTAQGAQLAELLAKAIEQGLITQAEADIFRTVHEVVEQYRADHPELVNQGEDIDEREAIILNALVKEQTVTQAQADAFKDIHDRLSASDWRR